MPLNPRLAMAEGMLIGVEWVAQIRGKRNMATLMQSHSSQDSEETVRQQMHNVTRPCHDTQDGRMHTTHTIPWHGRRRAWTHEDTVRRWLCCHLIKRTRRRPPPQRLIFRQIRATTGDMGWNLED